MLADAGLVSVRRDGRRRLYRARPEQLGPLRAVLEDLWRSGLEELATLAEAGLDRSRFLDAFDGGGHRRGVVADWEEGRRRGVDGSPHAFLPDGTGVFNPGIGKIDWVRGIPVPRQVDEGAVARLLERAATG